MDGRGGLHSDLAKSLGWGLVKNTLAIAEDLVLNHQRVPRRRVDPWIRWIPKEANRAADQLVNLTLDNGMAYCYRACDNFLNIHKGFPGNFQVSVDAGWRNPSSGSNSGRAVASILWYRPPNGGWMLLGAWSDFEADPRPASNEDHISLLEAAAIHNGMRLIMDSLLQGKPWLTRLELTCQWWHGKPTGRSSSSDPTRIKSQDSVDTCTGMPLSEEQVGSLSVLHWPWTSNFRVAP